MTNWRLPRTLAVTVAGLSLSLTVAAADTRPPPLPIEPTGRVNTLPYDYPESWYLVHDAAFFHMSDGKVYIIDVDAENIQQQVKGTFNVSLMGNVLESPARKEIYAAETFHTRGTRGDRIDVVTIWDKSTLKPKGEVVWPVPSRFMGMPFKFAMTTTHDDRYLLVANMNPAASATVIDLDDYSIANEVATPGCAFIYPTGKHGFSSLCPDGRILSTVLDADGKVIKQERSERFFDSDDTPVFERTAIINGIAYFPTFQGMVHPVDLRGETAKIGKAWDAVPEADKAQNWRPGGIDIVEADGLGRLYLLMHPDGADGTQNGGGPEIWVYNPETGERVQRIALQEWGISMALSRGEKPRLLVTNPVDMSLELYDALSGEFVRKITGFGQETPLTLNATR